MRESIDTIFDKNEQQVNNILSVVIFCVIPLYAVLILAIHVGFFPGADIGFLCFSWLFTTLISVINFLNNEKRPANKLNKYVLLILIGLNVFFLSIIKGLNVYICYVLPVLISCLYCSEIFTLQISVFSMVFVIISCVIKTENRLDFYVNRGTRLWWGLTTSVGTLFEFLLYTVFCLYFARCVRHILVSTYKHKISIAETQNQLIHGFANMIEAKDSCTGEHIKRTSEYVKLICMKLQERKLYPDAVNEQTTEVMVRAAPFHDLGKIGVPDSILNKRDKLTSEEFAIIKDHPLEGAEFLSKKLGSLDDRELIKTAKEMALCHHEHLDGSGYPYGLVEEQIPISARIMAVADILDALLSERPYKSAYSIEESLKIIKEMSGSALDPIIVYVILNSEDEIRIIRDGGTIKYEYK